MLCNSDFNYSKKFYYDANKINDFSRDVFNGKDGVILDVAKSDDKYFMRMPTNSDSDIYGLYTCYNDKNVKKYLPSGCIPLSAKDASEMIDYYLMMHKKKTGFYYFVEKNNSSVVGVFGLHSYDKYDSNIELTYQVLTKESGLGIATLASRKLLEFAFESLKVKRASLTIATDNFKSKSLANRLNFIFEGRLRQARLLHKNLIDVDIYSMVSKEYFANKKYNTNKNYEKYNTNHENNLLNDFILIDNNSI